jgi:hypothetical protein
MEGLKKVWDDRTVNGKVQDSQAEEVTYQNKQRRLVLLIVKGIPNNKQQMSDLLQSLD